MNNKRIIGHEQEYPGSYAWPIYEYHCPDCGKWTQKICDIDGQDKDGEYTPLCEACGNEVAPHLIGTEQNG